MKKYLRLLMVAFMSLFVYQIALAQHSSNHQKNLIQVIEHQKNLSTLVKALKASGLVDTLKGAGPYTVFAPTNAAFDKLPKGTLDSLLKDKSQLASLLSYHVVSGKILAKDVQNGPVTTLQGQQITLNNSSGTLQVNNAKVEKTDIEASNGVVHEIDAVLMPNNQNNVGGANQQGGSSYVPGTDNSGATPNTGSTDTTNNTDTSTNTTPGTSPTTAPNSYPNTPDNNNNNNPNTMNNPNAITPTPSNPNPNTPAQGGPTNTNMYQPSVPTQNTTTPTNE